MNVLQALAPLVMEHVVIHPLSVMQVRFAKLEADAFQRGHLHPVSLPTG